MKNNLFIVAQSGWKYIITTGVLFLIFFVLDFDVLSFVTFVGVLFLLFVFRNPERELFNFEEDSILSPVDGVVSAINEIHDSEYAYQIDIKSSYLDVSLLRTPLNATVESLTFEHGTRVSSDNHLFKTLNENVQIVFLNSNGVKIKVVHRLAQSFAPLSIDAIKSQTLSKSARYGLMLCGVTSIYLPHNVRVNVNLLNEVKASQTLLANLS